MKFIYARDAIDPKTDGSGVGLLPRRSNLPARPLPTKTKPDDHKEVVSSHCRPKRGGKDKFLRLLAQVTPVFQKIRLDVDPTIPLLGLK